MRLYAIECTQTFQPRDRPRGYKTIVSLPWTYAAGQIGFRLDGSACRWVPFLVDLQRSLGSDRGFNNDDVMRKGASIETEFLCSHDPI